HGQRLRVSIGDDEVDALEPGPDHVVDCVAAGTADAEHGDTRLHLANIGDLQVDAHSLPLMCMCRSATGKHDVKFGSEAFAQPSSDLRDVAAGSCHQMPHSPRFDVFE